MDDVTGTLLGLAVFPCMVLLCSLGPACLLLYSWWDVIHNPEPREPTPTTKLMVVLGSGGHTAEMLSLVGSLDPKRYTPRCYVAADTDALSLTKALAFEEQRRKGKRRKGDDPLDVATFVIPRSREVGQSYATSVLTTLRALRACAGQVFRERPDLVLVNGPGTCIPICMAAFLLRLSRKHDTRIAYVESIARVTSLSLTGRILYRTGMADAFLVQWPKLQQAYPAAAYVGRVM